MIGQDWRPSVALVNLQGTEISNSQCTVEKQVSRCQHPGMPVVLLPTQREGGVSTHKECSEPDSSKQANRSWGSFDHSLGDSTNRSLKTKPGDLVTSEWSHLLAWSFRP